MENIIVKFHCKQTSTKIIIMLYATTVST